MFYIHVIKNKKFLFLTGLAIVITLVGVAAVVLFLATRSASEIPFSETIKTEPKVVSVEVLPLASGKQTYEILTGSPKKFKIMEVSIDPLDVKQGEIQTVQVLVRDTENNPIAYENKVEAVVYTDNMSFPFSFSLKKVEDSDGAIVTIWEGFWVLDDTYNLRYMMAIKAKSATEEHSIDLTFR